MELTQFGELLQLDAGDARASEREPKVCSNWGVSEETRSRIEKIEATIRAADVRGIGVIIR